MKRVGNIYEKIYDMDNLKAAHKNARKDKSYYAEVQMVDSDPEFYLTKIQNILKNHTYYVQESDYTISKINDKGKERELWKLPYFPHRIIQWAIMLQIEPIFNQVFTDFTCASLPNRGIHKVRYMLKNYLKDTENTKYCLKIDIHHFYPSIDHSILKKMLRKKFKDEKLLSLFDMIIDSHPGKGIPIGSYLSQYFANFYLAYFDHWLKEELHLKYVIRYMDDVVILHSSKEYLHFAVRKIIDYLTNTLNVEIKSNWQVFPSNVRGIDFVGYRFFNNFILLRKKCCKRFKQAMRSIKKKWDKGKRISFRQFCTVNSYRGWLKWCDSYRLSQKYLTPVIPAVEDYYWNTIKRKVVKA